MAAALAATALLAAACGGGGSAAAAARPGTYEKALAFARCMRAHGEPAWPDPASNGTFKTAVELSSPQARSAHGACMYLLPASGGHISAAQLQKDASEALKQAECMRAHGITNFPDPVMLPNGGSYVRFGKSSGVDPSSPQFQAAQKACGSP